MQTKTLIKTTSNESKSPEAISRTERKPNSQPNTTRKIKTAATTPKPTVKQTTRGTSTKSKKSASTTTTKTKVAPANIQRQPPQDIRLVRSQTPWGQAQSAEDIAPGITRYTTASHGGYYLNSEANSQVAPQLKRSTLNSQGLKGWYEEDCDWAIVVYTFREYFPPQHYQLAIETLAQYHGTAWKALAARTQ